jgi:UDP-N-acetylmuramoyl-tripeptide--D-alanyl-D-alanine ligase
MRMRLTELITPLNAQLVGNDCAFERLSTDSRQLNAGDCFLALRGDAFDGHDFAVEVAEGGACALVVERELSGINIPQLIVADTTQALGQIGALRRAQFSGPVVAVTGSSGKTSVKGLLREIFACAGSVLATQGNFNNHIGVPLTLLRLQRENFAVIELGTNHPGEIAYLTGLVFPDIALVNNVMPAHIGGFGSLEAIAQEKGEIYSRLLSHQTAVINLEDRFAPLFCESTQHCRQVGFALQPTDKKMATVCARDLEWDQWGRASFAVSFAGANAATHLKVPGLHYVRNALAAAACALAAGCSLTQVAEGLGNFRGEKGRMQICRGRSESWVIDDTYNANPGSVMAAIDYLSERPGKRILVLGDLAELGDLGPQSHRDIGGYAAQKNITALYTTGPLSALSAQAFGVGAMAFDNKNQLVENLLKQLDAQTTVLVKGSRSSRMDEVVQLICDAEEKRPC